MTDITFDSSSLDWDKLQGQAGLAPASVSASVPALVPAIVQHHLTGKVLMLGYMDKAALEKTLATKQVTFFSRSKQRLWTKGETSGNTLELIAIDKDCDNDSLLVQVIPNGPTCHKGTISCWLDGKAHTFMDNLTHLIISRKGQDADSSYTASLFKAGTKRIAQKVGEEGLETALAAATHDKEELVNEASDLMYHLLVLLEDQDLSMELVTKNLMQRHLKTKA